MQDQLSRGTEGFGAIFIDNKFKFKVERAVQETKILVDNYFNPCKMMILHHRTPSSSDNKINQTHPIVVEHESLKYNYLLIHNGIIKNGDELKEKHEKEGFKYTTDDKEDDKFNDSECIAIEIAKFIEEKTKEIEAIGSCAFIALKYDKKTKTALKVYYGRNTNPLKLAKSRNFLYLSSDGKGDDIKPDTLYNFDLKNFNITKQPMVIKTHQPVIITTVKKDEIITTNVEGFKDNSVNTEMEDWEMEQTVEENQDIIKDKIDKLYTNIKDPEKIFSMNINEEIKEIIAILVIETKDAYKTAAIHQADTLMKEQEELDIELKEKLEEEKLEKNETKKNKLPSVTKIEDDYEGISSQWGGGKKSNWEDEGRYHSR